MKVDEKQCSKVYILGSDLGLENHEIFIEMFTDMWWYVSEDVVCRAATKEDLEEFLKWNKAEVFWDEGLKKIVSGRLLTFLVFDENCIQIYDPKLRIQF